MSTSWKRTGPLTENQHRVLAALSEGLDQGQVAARIHLARQSVSENLCAAAVKMGAGTNQEAIARYRGYLVRKELAGFVGDMADQFAAPSPEAARHTRRILRHVAKLILQRAEKELPQ